MSIVRSSLPDATILPNWLNELFKHSLINKRIFLIYFLINVKKPGQRLHTDQVLEVPNGGTGVRSTDHLKMSNL
jgi:hypothetical protein